MYHQSICRPWKTNQTRRYNLVIHGYRVILVVAATGLLPRSTLKGHPLRKDMKQKFQVLGFFTEKEKSFSHIKIKHFSFNLLANCHFLLSLFKSDFFFLCILVSNRKVRAKQSNSEFSTFKSKILTLCLSFFFFKQNSAFHRKTTILPPRISSMKYMFEEVLFAQSSKRFLFLLLNYSNLKNHQPENQIN